ncbi:aminopeptidase N [Pimephales promelas]|nr:aminopeptidase N [Pimephales promelas]
MAKATGISKAVAVGIGVITVSSVCGLVLMVVMFQLEIEGNPPLVPPTPTKPQVIPTDLPTNLRLFDYLIPESYNVVLQPYFYGAITNNYTNQSFFFTGNSTVKFKCMKDSKTIFLHVHNLNVTNVEVKSDSNEILKSSYTIHYNASNFLEIQLEGKLSGNGTYYHLFTNFEGELFENLNGLYVNRYTEKSKDEDEEDEERFLATSLLKPTDARRVFPCFDEPALKATFKITIIHRPGIKALSNGVGDEYSIEIHGEEWVVTQFPTTPNMSTYLLAFTLSDFTSKSIPAGTYMHIYAHREAIAAGHADYAAEITHPILIRYEKEFGLKYPLQQLDQIALPDFSVGVMENWGLISYQESGLLYDKDTGSTFDKERVATQIAHGLAHQKDLIVLREIQSAFQVDSLNSSHPLSMYENDIQTFSEIIELFDDVTYSKVGMTSQL